MSDVRDGTMVTANGAKKMMALGWRLTRTNQVVDGVSFWELVHDESAATRLVSICGCDEIGLHPE